MACSTVLVLTTLPATADAAAFARRLVDARLAACVTIAGPVRSVYRWQGAVEESEEQQLVIKSDVDRLPALKDRLAEWHPYEVPELLVLPVADGGAAYLAWVRQSLAD